MKILKARTQFATNSSSTHSLLFVDRSVPTTEKSQFGWEHFTAADRESKENYFAITIFNSLRWSVGEDAARIILRDLLARDVGDKVLNHGYIDHQSEYLMPMDWKGLAPNLEFAREFRDFLLQDNIAILGGSDNDEMTHPLNDGNAFVLPIGMDGRTSALVARKDPLGFWTLFNRIHGNKVRFMFPEAPKKRGKEKECPQCDGGREYPKGNCETCHGDKYIYEKVAPVYNATPKHSTYPELIDIKITDFCAAGCTYCYQGSTIKGQHAEDMWRIVSACEEMQVFEVAIGGGEPLSHPGFVNILRQFRSAGVVPNFSTRNRGWLTDPKKAEEILDLCGSYAFSIDTANDLQAIHGEISYRNYKEPSIHVVMGMVDDYQLRMILQFCKENYLHVVLLGYKTTGRGSEVTPRDDSKWLDIVKEVKGDGRMNISVDTALVAKHSDKLKDAGIPEEFLERNEGRFSMYIDAVRGQFGPSSYCETKDMIDLPCQDIPDAIEASLRKWTEEGAS